MQFNQMQFRAVAFVLAEAILGKTRAEVAHNRIASDFRDHRRRRDAETVAIAIDDRGLRQRKGKDRQAVDENVLRLKGEGGNRRAHRFMGEEPQPHAAGHKLGIEEEAASLRAFLGVAMSLAMAP